MAPAPARFSLFVEAVQEEEDEFVWGAMAELEEVGEIEGLVTIRAQERQEIVQGAGKGNKDKSEVVTKKEKGKAEETRQLAYCREPRIANSEVSQQILQQILEVEVPKVRV